MVIRFVKMKFSEEKVGLKKKLVTVVVPSYNVENTLGETLDSLLDTKYLEILEIIVVNDGSKDNTVSVAQKYIEKYTESVRLISKENGGHGSTINAGILNATGKYFKVVDGDDWVEKVGWNNFLKKIKDTDSDIIVSNYYEVNDKTREKKEKILDANIDSETLLDFKNVSNLINVPMHGFTIRTSILRDNNIVIDEKCFYVDMEFILLPIPYVRTITFFKDFVYLYRVAQENQSISSKGWMAHRNDHIKVVKRLVKELKKDEKIAPKENYIYMENRVVKSIISRFSLGFKFEKDIIQEFLNEQKMLDDYLVSEFPNLYVKSGKNKMVYFLRKSNYNLVLYLFLRKIWRLQRIIRKKDF